MISEQRIVDLETKVGTITKELIDIKKVLEILAGSESVIDMLNKTTEDGKTGMFTSNTVSSTLKWVIAIALIFFAVYQVYLKYYSKQNATAKPESFTTGEDCEGGVCTLQQQKMSANPTFINSMPTNKVSFEEPEASAESEEDFDYS